MTTAHVTEALSAYLDGQVSAAEQIEIAQHLHTCAACRADLDALRRTVAVLHMADPMPAPAGFRQQVRVRLAQRAHRLGRAWRLPTWPRSWTIAGAVATVVVVGLFALNVLREQLPVTRREGAVPQFGGSPPAASPGRTRSAAALPGMAAPRLGGVPTAPVAPSPELGSLRRVIRTAQVNLEVDSVDGAASRLTRLAEDAGGFVAGSSSMQSGGRPEGSFVLRIPASRFADVLAQVEALGRVLGRRVGGQDVTEEYVDLRARIRNQERYEQRLLTFADRATNVADLLAIEQELARVRGEIEQLTGRLQFLARQVDLATIEVTVREGVPPLALWNSTDLLANMQAAFLRTLQRLLRAVEGLVVALSALLPILVLVGGAWLVIRRVRLARGR